MVNTIQRPGLLRRLAHAILPRVPAKGATSARMYAAARNTRTTGGFGSSGNSSADAELASSLTALRARSRQMVRDSAYAKRAKVVVINNVIGSGIGMQAQIINARGDLRKDANDMVEDAWSQWCEATNCHTGGALHFHDMERMAMGQVFDAGEIFIRKHYRAFGASRVPLTLEVIEPERIADNVVDPQPMNGNEVRMGVECDSFGRAIAYWIRERHPSDIRFVQRVDRYERVPAEDIWHLRIIDRWPQTRGEPWLHTAVRKLDDMNEYSAAELSAARSSALIFGTIKTPELESPLVTDEEADGTKVMDIQAGMIQELNPGEELELHNPNRPNAALDPFMRYMLREVAAGCGPSYESISRDYSQSNYSSSRLALLEDRDLWKVFQLWWIRNFRLPLHRIWLQQAMLGGAVGVPIEQYAANTRKFEAVHFKPRGWSWIDPHKEVSAFKEAIKAGLTTATDVIAQTADGRDIEDVIATAKREREMFAQAGILVDTEVMPAVQTPAPAPPPAAPPNDAADPPDEGADRSQPTTRSSRVVSLQR